MGDMLARDMKWPHCKGSTVPENTWNTALGELMAAILSTSSEEHWWCEDTDLKYLTLRIDTRDNAFILSVDGHGAGAQKVRIDPQRVVDAIQKHRARWGTTMTDRPIDIPASRIPAVLDGRMTQYRVPLKPQPVFHPDGVGAMGYDWHWSWLGGKHGPTVYANDDLGPRIARSGLLPHAIGDRLWLRERFAVSGFGWGKPLTTDPGGRRHYLADPDHGWKDYWGKPRPSITMPRWASRITLTVTDLAVHRVQDISADDIYAEGTPGAWDYQGKHTCLVACRNAFRDLWNATHGNGAWDRNDWVLARTFRVHLCNIDQMEEADG